MDITIQLHGSTQFKKTKPQQLLHVLSTFYPQVFTNGRINAIQGVVLRDRFYWTLLGFKND